MHARVDLGPGSLNVSQVMLSAELAGRSLAEPDIPAPDLTNIGVARLRQHGLATQLEIILAYLPRFPIKQTQCRIAGRHHHVSFAAAITIIVKEITRRAVFADGKLYFRLNGLTGEGARPRGKPADLALERLALCDGFVEGRMDRVPPPKRRGVFMFDILCNILVERPLATDLIVVEKRVRPFGNHWLRHSSKILLCYMAKKIA